jgi:hypothetical protein
LLNKTIAFGSTLLFPGLHNTGGLACRGAATGASLGSDDAKETRFWEVCKMLYLCCIFDVPEICFQNFENQRLMEVNIFVGLQQTSRNAVKM